MWPRAAEYNVAGRGLGTHVLDIRLSVSLRFLAYYSQQTIANRRTLMPHCIYTRRKHTLVA
jgi:hypothetical protein